MWIFKRQARQGTEGPEGRRKRWACGGCNPFRRRDPKQEEERQRAKSDPHPDPLTDPNGRRVAQPKLALNRQTIVCRQWLALISVLLSTVATALAVMATVIPEWSVVHGRGVAPVPPHSMPSPPPGAISYTFRSGLWKECAKYWLPNVEPNESCQPLDLDAAPCRTQFIVARVLSITGIVTAFFMVSMAFVISLDSKSGGPFWGCALVMGTLAMVCFMVPLVMWATIQNENEPTTCIAPGSSLSYALWFQVLALSLMGLALILILCQPMVSCGPPNSSRRPLPPPPEAPRLPFPKRQDKDRHGKYEAPRTFTDPLSPGNPPLIVIERDPAVEAGDHGYSNGGAYIPADDANLSAESDLRSHDRDLHSGHHQPGDWDASGHVHGHGTSDDLQPSYMYLDDHVQLYPPPAVDLEGDSIPEVGAHDIPSPELW
uniref:Uncharacterized protein n=1 Tax=Eutreptiella gymnastica TaxID=73025 RepID=A0A7S1NBQ5_9EUGL|mmetsp:Transcript_150700/g.263377  ORF Transcript_150700/g.263377 Transcript_150700/m.263377 type:complete len:430 (+) Transcript_150700:126-1415(+)